MRARPDGRLPPRCIQGFGRRCAAGVCSSQTTAVARSSLMTPSKCTATFGHPGQSHRYSVSVSSWPSACRKPVLMVTSGIVGSLSGGQSRIPLMSCKAHPYTRPPKAASRHGSETARHSGVPGKHPVHGLRFRAEGYARGSPLSGSPPGPSAALDDCGLRDRAHRRGRTRPDVRLPADAGNRTGGPVALPRAAAPARERNQGGGKHLVCGGTHGDTGVAVDRGGSAGRGPGGRVFGLSFAVARVLSPASF